ncbi:MAG TPA: hypothetical protein VKG82_06900 [Solirubrobacteraceae bacterium]|nr:hypothetical protein [Solirubrobacteraceae bacterium]
MSTKVHRDRVSRRLGRPLQPEDEPQGFLDCLHLVGVQALG